MTEKDGLVIRDVTLEDAAALVGILNPIIEAGSFTVLDEPYSVEQERQFIASFPARGIFHVAARATDGRVVGMQSVEPFGTYTKAFDHVGVIGTYVDLACRRQGIGARLFAETFRVAREKGYEKMFTFVRGDNAAALGAYSGQGFTVIGTAARHAKLRDGRYVDEIMIETFL